MKEMTHQMFDGFFAAFLFARLLPPLFLGRRHGPVPLLSSVNHGGDLGLGQLQHRVGGLRQSTNGSDRSAILSDLSQVAEVHDVRTAGKVDADVDSLENTKDISIF
jgi:hypothetical protein